MEDRSQRYARHEVLAEIGPEGQARLASSRVAVVGVGALGSNAANLLARSGVGYLRLIDGDTADWSNLHRQTLYDEDDVLGERPKAVAAAAHLARINSEVACESVVTRLTAENAEALIADVDLVVDGLDNFAGRAVMNVACVRFGKPMVHGACLSTHGSVATIVPGRTACLQCLLPDIGNTEVPATAREAGVLGAMPAFVAAWQVAEALKILVGDLDAISKNYVYLSLWPGGLEAFPAERRPDCPVCGHASHG